MFQRWKKWQNWLLERCDLATFRLLSCGVHKNDSQICNNKIKTYGQLIHLSANQVAVGSLKLVERLLGLVAAENFSPQ